MKNFNHIDQEKVKKAFEVYKKSTNLKSAAGILGYGDTHTHRIFKHFFGNEYLILAKEHKIAASRKSILKAQEACKRKFGANYTQVLGKITYQKYGREYYSRLGIKTICKRSNRKPFGSAFEEKIAKVLSEGCSFVLYEPILITSAQYFMPDFFVPPNTVIEVLGGWGESYTQHCQIKLDTYNSLNLQIILVAKSQKHIKKLVLPPGIIIIYEKSLGLLPRLIRIRRKLYEFDQFMNIPEVNSRGHLSLRHLRHPRYQTVPARAGGAGEAVRQPGSYR